MNKAIMYIKLSIGHQEEALLVVASPIFINIPLTIIEMQSNKTIQVSSMCGLYLNTLTDNEE